MDLRNDLQKLAIWYIPVAVLFLVASTWYSGLMRETLVINDLTPGTALLSLSLIPTVMKLSTNFVVAIWLYYMVNKSSGNKYIWFLFGLIAHLLAVIIYIGLALYEQLASNNSSNLTGAENAPPS